MGTESRDEPNVNAEIPVPRDCEDTRDDSLVPNGNMQNDATEAESTTSTLPSHTTPFSSEIFARLTMSHLPMLPFMGLNNIERLFAYNIPQARTDDDTGDDEPQLNGDNVDDDMHTSPQYSSNSNAIKNYDGCVNGSNGSNDSYSPNLQNDYPVPYPYLWQPNNSRARDTDLTGPSHPLFNFPCMTTGSSTLPFGTNNATTTSNGLPPSQQQQQHQSASSGSSATTTPSSHNNEKSPTLNLDNSRPVSSTSGNDQSAAAAATTGAGKPTKNYQADYKELYAIDDDPGRAAWLDDFLPFADSHGMLGTRLPVMAKSVLDLYKLYQLVVARGGLVEVIVKKLWQEIIRGLRLPSTITSAAFTLRTQHMRYLYPYECARLNLSNPEELAAAVEANKREGRRQDLRRSASPINPRLASYQAFVNQQAHFAGVNAAMAAQRLSGTAPNGVRLNGQTQSLSQSHNGNPYPFTAEDWETRMLHYMNLISGLRPLSSNQSQGDAPSTSTTPLPYDPQQHMAFLNYYNNNHSESIATTPPQPPPPPPPPPPPSSSSAIVKDEPSESHSDLQDEPINLSDHTADLAVANKMDCDNDSSPPPYKKRKSSHTTDNDDNASNNSSSTSPNIPVLMSFRVTSKSQSVNGDAQISVTVDFNGVLYEGTLSAKNPQSDTEENAVL